MNVVTAKSVQIAARCRALGGLAMRCRTLSLLLIALFFAAAIPDPAAAFFPDPTTAFLISPDATDLPLLVHHHQGITASALAAVAFPPSCIPAVMKAVRAVDIEDNAPNKISDLFVETHPPYDPKHHFDRNKHDGDDVSTGSRAAFQRGIKYLHEQRRRIVSDPNADVLTEIGKALHALQDFFAHSNFVDLPPDRQRPIIDALLSEMDDVSQVTFDGPDALRITAFGDIAEGDEYPHNNIYLVPPLRISTFPYPISRMRIVPKITIPGIINISGQAKDHWNHPQHAAAAEVARSMSSVFVGKFAFTDECRPAKTSGEIKIVGALDPNDKVGNSGVAEPNYVSGVELLHYAIFFENVDTATAPAQEVVISDQLDATTMELATFGLGPISFGDRSVVPPPGQRDYTADVDLRPTTNLIVRVSASLDLSSGAAIWRFTSLDPATGLPPDDPLAGFLPPNTTPPSGQGSVTFSILPKQGLPTGTEIRNKAQIVFDTNAPIDTPQVRHTLDNAAPTSNVAALATLQTSPTFVVNWSGSDVGSGLLDYTIYVSKDGGDFEPFVSNTVLTSAPFTGQSGATYSFFSVARDQAGNVEEKAQTVEAITQIVPTASTPLVAWATPPDIVYGTPLGGAQLNATASVPGTFTYVPPAGTVLNAGSEQTLVMTFTPTDTQRYTRVTASVSITVLKASPTITWNNPPDITYGTALSPIQLNATTPSQGTFSYSIPAGTLLQAGNAQTLNVTFVPSDARNYATVEAAVTINVLKATPVIAWASPGAIVYGMALDGTQLNATTQVAGSFVYVPPAGTLLNAGGGQTLAVTFVPADSANYTTASSTVTINVSRATATVTVTGGTFTYDGAAHAGAGVASGVGGLNDLLDPAVTLSYAGTGATAYGPTGESPTNAGTYLVTAAFAGNANYLSSSRTVPLTINKAAATLSFADFVQIYTGNATPVRVISTPAGLGGVAVRYNGSSDVPTAAGSYSVVATLLNDNYAATATNDTLVILQASAGANQTVNEGAAVTLTGVGYGLTYRWTQLAPSTPIVTLSDPSALQTSFSAPELPGGFGSTAFTFQLTAFDGSVSTASTVNVTVVNVNHAPVAEPGNSQTVMEGSLVTLDGTGSYDPDHDPITYIWTQVSGPPVTLTDSHAPKVAFTAPTLPGGVSDPVTLMFSLTVSDGGRTDTKSVNVTVDQVDHAPVANAGSSQTVSVGSLVTLDGSASRDPDNDAITSYSWSQVAGTPVSLDTTDPVRPKFTAPKSSGPVTFSLVVSDGVLVSTNLAQVTIAVVDANVRCGQAYPSVKTLWPPDHRLVPVAILGVFGAGNTGTVRITSVTQDEPVSGLGDGDTAPDAVIQGASVLLRAERSASGDGRVYKVNFTASDSASPSCQGSVMVGVPHDQGRGKVAIDSGQKYDSTNAVVGHRDEDDDDKDRDGDRGREARLDGDRD